MRRILFPKVDIRNLPTVLVVQARTSDNLDLGDSVRISKDDTNLRWGGTLAGEFSDLVNDLLRSSLQP